MKKLIVTFLIVSAFTCGCTQSENSNDGKICNANIQRINKDLASNQQQTPETNSGSLEETSIVNEKLHPIEIEEQECMKKADYTTAGMNECSYKAMNKWFNEIDKYLGLLKTVTSEEEYANILKAQENWKKYQESEFVAISIIMNKQGTIYQNILSGCETGLIKQRAVALKNLYEYLVE